MKRRKLKLQMQVSLDGFIAGLKGEMDWMEWNWDAALLEYVQGITSPVDTIIMGRVLAEGFIDHWANAAANTPIAEDPFTHKMADTPKVVFTKTMKENKWANTELASGGLIGEIKKLKKQKKRGDIIVYGGGSFVSALIKNNLIDEYHFFINPTAIGKGMPIFKALSKNLNLQLVEAKGFECGIVVNCYVPKKEA
jgi:dihydrofolate reductase